VTMRTMSQSTWIKRWLALVTAPSDGLPDPSQSSTVQRGPSPCPFPNGRRLILRATRAPLSPGSRSHLDVPTSYRNAASKPRAGAAAASSKETLHTAGVVSRVSCNFVLLRQTRWTETLTGQAIHTSSIEASTKD